MKDAVEASEVRRRLALRIDAVIALLSLIWGTTYFVIAKGLEDLPPMTAAGARFALAAVVFAAMAHVLARRESGARPSAGLSVVMGLFNFFGPYSLVYLAETRLPSGLVSVLWATFPMMLAVLSHVMLAAERLGPRKWAGFAIGFGGVVLLFATDLAGVDRDGVPYGLMLLGSPALAALGNVLVKKHGARVNSLLLTRNGLALAAPLMLATAFLTERGEPVHWTPTALASVVYLAVVGTVVTFSLYFWALRYAPAHRMGLITYLTPTIALAIGSLAGGEPFHWHTFVGTGLILVSVWLVVRTPRRRARSA